MTVTRPDRGGCRRAPSRSRRVPEHVRVVGGGGSGTRRAPPLRRRIRDSPREGDVIDVDVAGSRARRGGRGDRLDLRLDALSVSRMWTGSPRRHQPSSMPLPGAMSWRAEPVERLAQFAGGLAQRFEQERGVGASLADVLHCLDLTAGRAERRSMTVVRIPSPAAIRLRDQNGFMRMSECPSFVKDLEAPYAILSGASRGGRARGEPDLRCMHLLIGFARVFPLTVAVFLGIADTFAVYVVKRIRRRETDPSAMSPSQTRKAPSSGPFLLFCGWLHLAALRGAPP